MSANLCILGAGSWGTALALQAARNGFNTVLWGHNPQHIAQIKLQGENARYLPGFQFPANLNVTDNLEAAVHESQLILLVVPSHAFKKTLLDIQALLTNEHAVAWATKGFDHDNGALLSEITATILGETIATAVLSGPTFAQEVAAGLPTALTIASKSDLLASSLTQILHNPTFRTYTSNDLIGVQIGGACKNVLAIAAGIADGLGFGANTRAALITRGLSEIIRLGTNLGGQADTFMGLTGLGDLILTCTDNQSRNRRFGLALGKGDSREQALQSIAQEVEGISAARQAYLLSLQHGVDMPITEQVYKVLFEGLSPKAAVQNLLGRDQKPEITIN